MTQSSYILASFLMYFGVSRKTRRMTDAAFEMHLMQDGEEILGAYCWRNIEPIEELSMEYWNLRRLEREEKSLLSQAKDAESTLSDAQKQRVLNIDRSKGLGNDFLDERAALLEIAEAISSKREVLMEEAIQTKKKHSAVKLKVKVLQEEGPDEEPAIEAARKKLGTLRETFTHTKEELATLNEQSSQLKKELEKIDCELDLEANDWKGESTEAFFRISKANRDITEIKAKLGLLREKQGVLYREVGRFLNVNAKREDCRDAYKEQRGILEQTRLLFHSIELNRKLIEKLGG